MKMYLLTTVALSALLSCMEANPKAIQEDPATPTTIDTMEEMEHMKDMPSMGEMPPMEDMQQMDPSEQAETIATDYAVSPTPVADPATAVVDDSSKFDHGYAAWTRVLQKHLHGDLLDYGGIKQDRAELNAIAKSFEAVTNAEYESFSRDQRYAFWINTYNVFCIQLVVDNYPVDSIKDIGSLLSPVWKKEFISLKALQSSGKADKLSLDTIEHKILRPTFKDARVHAAINCASASCPPLAGAAFRADRLSEQLDQAVRNWIADPTRNRLDAKNKTVHHSELFGWFADDFKRDAGSIQAWIARYAPKGSDWIKTKGVKFKTLDYSWKLNDHK